MVPNRLILQIFKDLQGASVPKVLIPLDMPMGCQLLS